MSESSPFYQSISGWFRRNFSDPEAISLFMTLVLSLIFLEVFGRMFMPILVSIVIAYLLAGLVHLLVRWRIPHFLAVIIVYLLFIGLVVYLVVGLIPLLWEQLANLVQEIPNAFNQSQTWLNNLIASHPNILSQEHIQQFSTIFKDHATEIGQYVVKYTVSAIPSVFQVIIYFILVPILVFFFVKDAESISHWFDAYRPRNRSLTAKVWAEVNEKIGCYVRGRVLEIIIVGVVTATVFSFMGLQYAILLGALVGLSVIIPYVGAVLVTIPVVIIALMQWGWAAHFAYVIIVYAAIIVLDAYLLVPFLFSESMDLHPLVIILAVVVFGAFWGFWGIFFAIPLATLINVVLKNWPRDQDKLLGIEKQS